MAIMDIPTIEPLVRALPKLLAKGGMYVTSSTFGKVRVWIQVNTLSFMATVLHPVFFTSNATRKIEIDFDRETGKTQVTRSKVIKDYLFVPPYKGWALPGQPRMQVGHRTPP